MPKQTQGQPKMPDQSNSLTSDEVNYLAIILEIVETRNWYALAYALKNHTLLFAAFARLLARTDELNGMTILHAVLRHDPPAEIVKALLDLVPEQAAHSDCLGRLPLHVAAGCRCSPRAVRLLVDRHPDACLARDADGKTPLILACNAGCELFEGDAGGGRAKSPPSLDVVRTLVSGKIKYEAPTSIIAPAPLMSSQSEEVHKSNSFYQSKIITYHPSRGMWTNYARSIVEWPSLFKTKRREACDEGFVELE
ncbi:hypothetical protein THAOC_35372 [Thalassiosira oceanica]|uniref:Uncharacterized protein n=1 Tax=Thalassiosira oceanica TaxID=159749 RepID=K0R3H3_THAOC|nr:hypothetical protein THAOC_35372 [Thalassiosira oceanica]|eukprot:EJK45984.1 hypothetical protein THAOC_35372 [Thalassiosira oceanica]